MLLNNTQHFQIFVAQAHDASLGYYMSLVARKKDDHRVNPFVPNAPFLYPLKTSENVSVFRCFQGVEKRCIAKEWVNTNL